MVLISLVVILFNISGHLWLLFKRMFAMMIAVMSVPVLLTVLLISLLLLVMATMIMINFILRIYSGMVNDVD